MEMWTNPSCSKCAVALAELEEADVVVGQCRYLDHPPTADELGDVLRRPGVNPWQVTRLTEPMAIELGMADWTLDQDRRVDALVEHSELIQRPILLLDDGTAVVGRDADALRLAAARSRPE